MHIRIYKKAFVKFYKLKVMWSLNVIRQARLDSIGVLSGTRITDQIIFIQLSYQTASAVFSVLLQIVPK